ncbi:hypothetical protein Pmani_007813 [Petrolisthes manimaculis]|uniref:Uncharacterized protein n=1 Tax=Petrolisthes manimaculis TaxID=1843537 RepID=A0AAE1Q7U4_9EUCA|nr:hypothetical protein Pmani_007813 [Petrolisthes manimaculis]
MVKKLRKRTGRTREERRGKQRHAGKGRKGKLVGVQGRDWNPFGGQWTPPLITVWGALALRGIAVLEEGNTGVEGPADHDFVARYRLHVDTFLQKLQTKKIR